VKHESEPKYWNPYFAGAWLGAVLFASFFVTGHGLGASGGLARVLSATLERIAPTEVDSSSFFAAFGGGARESLDHWLVWEILGVVVGGAVSGWMAGRMQVVTQRGPRLGVRLRLLFALVGGFIAGWATQLSRGCTSGQALSGGASLSAGSWAFMFAVFGGAYLVAYPFRKLWR
jgi:uncharacterized membrane protein YedE/YeeE